MKAVLAIDGGGIRGLIPATKLAELEALTGRPCVKLFDAVSGTSTGGILALGIALGIPAARMAALYMEHGKDIFARHWWRLTHLLRSKYDPSGIDGILRDTFGNATLGDCKCEVMIASYDCDKEGPMFFHASARKHLLVRDVARATAAAPTYFPAGVIEATRYIDGGMWANNPADIAYEWSKRMWPGEDLLTVSLGTGAVKGTALPRRLNGLLQIGPHVIEIFLAAQSAAAHKAMVARTVRDAQGRLEYANTPLGEAGDTYIRDQPVLSKEHISLDHVWPENLQALVAAARQNSMSEVVQALAFVEATNAAKG